MQAFENKQKTIEKNKLIRSRTTKPSSESKLITDKDITKYFGDN